ncbi:MAG: glycosyltransferase family 4 protein [Muribaculaceae bacterium]|nr:glycosyltransferase family 4 protein [Muribaculaceae bacterium]
MNNIDNGLSDKKIRIGFLSQFSPFDKRASSGTNYSIAKQLSKIGELEWIPIRERPLHRYIRGAGRRIARLFGKNFDLANTRFGSKLLFHNVNDEVFRKYDIVCAFFCMSNMFYLDFHKIPVIYFSDATFPCILNYYPTYTNLPGFGEREGRILEEIAVSKATCCVYGSDWAAQSAIMDLKKNPDQVKVVEYGANISDEEIEKYNKIHKAKEFSLPLQILFLGVDWNRKGGNIAAEAVGWLNSQGIPATLHVVGIPPERVPEKYGNLDYVKLHGFLNKNVESDYEKLASIIQTSHCLLLPTKAECSAIAFAEASAFGLPIFTHDTGGIANYVIGGLNGYRLPLGSTGEDFGRQILLSFQNDELSEMSLQGQRLYKEKLNWNHWGEEIKKIINEIMRVHSTC